MPAELFHCLARGDEFSAHVRGNMIAVYHGDYSNDLYAISIAGHERTIQFAAAGLAKGVAGVEFFFDDYQPLRRKGAAAGSGVAVKPVSGGYHCHRQHLGYDTWQLLAWSKAPKFLLDGSDEALWRVLRGDQFTTPLLRHWMPAIRAAMVPAGLLKECTTIGMERPAQIVMATDPSLDKLVSEGIARGLLTFQTAEAAVAAA